MQTMLLEIDEIQRRPIRTRPKTTPYPQGRIGSGIALATQGSSSRPKDNPHHWQTLVLLVPLLHNPDDHNNRKPIPRALIQRTIDEIQRMFSGYTLARVMGWYWDETKNTGVPDELMRLDVDGVFTGSDLRELHEWKKKLRRRFRQDFIYMRLVPSGVAI